MGELEILLPRTSSSSPLLYAGPSIVANLLDILSLAHSPWCRHAMVADSLLVVLRLHASRDSPSPFMHVSPPPIPLNQSLAAKAPSNSFQIDGINHVPAAGNLHVERSEERRVGKECRL